AEDGIRDFHVTGVQTCALPILGILTGIAMIGVTSILDVWWQLSGIFAGGMLGLFLLGIISKKANNSDAIVATVAGVMAILWMTRSEERRVGKESRTRGGRYDSE